MSLCCINVIRLDLYNSNQDLLYLLPLVLNIIGMSGYSRKKIQNYSYALADIIGKGYSSQVYKGRNDATLQPVAIKVIDLKMLKTDINRVLLQSEIQILGQLKQKEHILALHQVYTTKNNTYIVTELCDNDLAKFVKKGINEVEAINFMMQIIKGYHHCIQANVIHRDLKPANLLICGGVLKIADFGFGVKVEEVGKFSKYNVGSPLYMAPQSLKRNQYSTKTDIWALGIIFYEMLTGETPWKAKNEKELIKKIETECIDDILVRKGMGKMAKEFISRALVADKQKRMTAVELKEFVFIEEEGQSALDTPSFTPSQSILTEKKLNSSHLPNRTAALNAFMTPKPTDKSVENNSSNRAIFMTPKQSDLSIENRPASRQPSSAHKFTSFRAQAVNTSMKTLMNRTNPIGFITPTVNPEDHVIETEPNAFKGQVPLKKQEKKHISKLLIAQVHFSRFLFKLLARIKESNNSQGLISLVPQKITKSIMQSYTSIIKHKVLNLVGLKDRDFIKIGDKYNAYKETDDYKKLMKIGREYKQRYTTELKEYWVNASEEYAPSSSETLELINALHAALTPHLGIPSTSPSPPHANDIIILDYLMTCRQLLDMIAEGEDFERFAKKSRIEEIVEGRTAEIGWSLFRRIMERASEMIGSQSAL